MLEHLWIGYFISPKGGAHRPWSTKAGTLLFEIITAGTVYSPAQDTTRGAGWVFCHRAGEESIWKSPHDEHYECLTVLFEAEKLTPPENWPRSFFWGDCDAAISFSHEILKAFHHTDIAHDVLENLIWSTLRFRLDSFRRSEERREIPPRISAIMSYIERYYSQDLGIEELANQVSLSPSHLHTRFKEYVGMSPHQYLIEQRMRSARHRLITTADPIKAISRGIGYANTETFCRMFKKRFKCTAAAYRKSYTIHLMH